MTLPNFLVIGANKAGTTSLARYLQQHPDVYMSAVKEPGFFVLEDGDPTAAAAPGSTFTFDSYTALFDAVTTERAWGEASTAYLGSPKAPDAIRRHIPDARLVAVLRNPVDRAFSNYKMQVARGRENLDFGEAIRAELDGKPPPPGVRERRYVRLGFYGRYLEGYWSTFDTSQLHVALYDDYRRDAAGVLKEIFGFLDVDDSFVPDTSMRHHVSYVPKIRRLHGLLQSRVAPVGVPSGGSRVMRYMSAWNRRAVPFPADVRRQLIDIYRADISVLQHLIRRDLSAWLT